MGNYVNIQTGYFTGGTIAGEINFQSGVFSGGTPLNDIINNYIEESILGLTGLTTDSFALTGGTEFSGGLSGDSLYIGGENILNIISNSASGETLFNEVLSYRSIYENGYIYEGFLKEGDVVIIRNSGDTKSYAINTTDLETNWINRATLNYN